MVTTPTPYLPISGDIQLVPSTSVFALTTLASNTSIKMTYTISSPHSRNTTQFPATGLEKITVDTNSNGIIIRGMLTFQCPNEFQKPLLNSVILHRRNHNSHHTNGIHRSLERIFNNLHHLTLLRTIHHRAKIVSNQSSVRFSIMVELSTPPFFLHSMI